jgi:hypothetical protein
VTRRNAPRLATWILNRFAAGPRREALIGDILEDFAAGRSITWYWRQVLTAAAVGSLVSLYERPRGVLRAAALAALTVCYVATTALLVRNGVEGGMVSMLLNGFIFIYCSVGFGALLLTIVEPVA